MMRADHRMDRLRVALASSGAIDGVALGHPGALVEQRGHRVERREVDLARAARRRPRSAAQAASKAACLRRVAEEAAASPASARRSPDAAAAAPAAPTRDRAAHRGPPASYAGRRRVDAAQASSTVSAKIETQSSVRQAGTTPRAESAPERRLQPDDVVERRRHPARARRVGAEREGDTSPRATATAEPEDEPPGTIAGSSALRGTG